MNLLGKTALVTGSNGFVGTFVTKRLLQEGARVRALVRNPDAAETMAALGAEPVYGDMTDAPAIRDAAAGAEIVVHCAISFVTDHAESRRINSGGTEALVQAAMAAGCERFIHLSSVSIYDNARAGAVIDENAPLLEQGDAYSESKIEAERAVLAAMGQGLKAIILRPGFIIGYHPRSVWGVMYPQAIMAGEFPLADEGRYQFPYVHVENLAEAIVLAIRTDQAIGQTMNIVDGQITWRRYAEYFRTDPQPSVAADQTWNVMTIRGQVSSDRARQVLGYVPRRTLDEAMRDSLEAL